MPNLTISILLIYQFLCFQKKEKTFFGKGIVFFLYFSWIQTRERKWFSPNIVFFPFFSFQFSFYLIFLNPNKTLESKEVSVRERDYVDDDRKLVGGGLRYTELSIFFFSLFIYSLRSSLIACCSFVWFIHTHTHT